MKYFLCLVASCLVFVTNVHATEPIRVESSGKTEREAIDAGFTKAIEDYVGTAVLSSREAKNDRLVKNELRTYSAGYVDKYNIVDMSRTKGEVSVVMDVWIKTSVLAEHKTALGSSTTDIDGNSLSAQIKTFVKERGQLDDFVNEVLIDYPSKGLQIKQGKPTIFMDNVRTPTISVDANISWDPKFLNSMRELMALVQDEPEYYDLGCFCYRARNQIAITYKKNEKDFFWEKDMFYLKDVTLANQISSTLSVPVKIIATVYDSDKRALHKECFWANEGYTQSDKFKDIFTINGSRYENARLDIPVRPGSSLYKNLNKVDSLELTLSRTCPA